MTKNMGRMPGAQGQHALHDVTCSLCTLLAPTYFNSYLSEQVQHNLDNMIAWYVRGDFGSSAKFQGWTSCKCFVFVDLI